MIPAIAGREAGMTQRERVEEAAARLRKGGREVAVVERLWGFGDLLAMNADEHVALLVCLTGAGRERNDPLPTILASGAAKAWLSVAGHHLEVWREGDAAAPQGRQAGDDAAAGPAGKPRPARPAATGAVVGGGVRRRRGGGLTHEAGDLPRPAAQDGLAPLRLAAGRLRSGRGPRVV
jgi:hypothetical protein